MSGNPVLRTSDISLPVLQSATSSRVSPQLGQKAIYSTASGHHQGQASEVKSQLKAERQEDEGLRKIQTKYASPDSVISVGQDLPDTALQNLPTEMSTQLIITNANNNFGHGDAVTGVNGFHPESGVGTPRKSRVNDSVSAFSDTSSDISDATTSVPSAGSSGSAVMTTTTVAIPVLEGINDQDVQQVEMFYRSHKTEVRVCSSLVNMYVSIPKTLDRMPAGQVSGNDGETNPIMPDPTTMSMEDWEFVKTGIPVLILNSGEHIRTRKLSLVLAERGTGFTLWEDALNHMTKYNTPHSNFHTLSLSTDSTRLVGFSFDEGKAADEFAEAVRSFLANPEDDLLKLSKKKRKGSKKKEKKPKYKPPRKIDISQPCCFVHVTKLERPTLMGLSPHMFPPPPSGADLSQVKSVVRSKSDSSELSECSTTPSEH